MRLAKLLCCTLCACLMLTACGSTAPQTAAQSGSENAEDAEVVGEPSETVSESASETASYLGAETVSDPASGTENDSAAAGASDTSDTDGSVVTNGTTAQSPDNSSSAQNSQESPVVYFTDDISPEGLVAVYEALGWTPTGKVAVKLSTGEPPASNYLNPTLIKDLVQSLDATIVECNTAYGGMRAATAEHYQVAEDHGFTQIADFQILDEDGYMEIPVNGGNRLTGDLVGAAFDDYDSYVILSHFKGHAMAGYGGAIKNSSIGLASSRGKVRIHSGGTSDTRWHDELHTEFLECMAEANKGVADYLGDRIIYINVLNRISIDCDCDGHPAEPDIHDIGIVASFDPVAADQACIDLVWDAEGSESLRDRINELDGLHTLEYAEQIGLGSRTYQLVNIK